MTLRFVGHPNFGRSSNSTRMHRDLHPMNTRGGHSVNVLFPSALTLLGGGKSASEMLIWPTSGPLGRSDSRRRDSLAPSSERLARPYAAEDEKRNGLNAEVSACGRSRATVLALLRLGGMLTMPHSGAQQSPCLFAFLAVI